MTNNVPKIIHIVIDTKTPYLIKLISIYLNDKRHIITK